MALNVQLLIIDPQNDFLDDPLGLLNPRPTLSVPGGTADMDRGAALVKRISKRVSDIHVSLDSHPWQHIAHPQRWVGVDGNPPPPFTPIFARDIRDGVWTPKHPNMRLAELEGKTIKQYCIEYAQKLEDQGNHILMIWPPHCLIGTPGQNVHPPLRDALLQWEDDGFGVVDWITKGMNPHTDQYGALYAEVPMPNDPSTGVRQWVLDMLAEADIIGALGEAESHCLRETLRQARHLLGDEVVRKIHLVKDCTSVIPKVGDGPDFPAITKAWEDEMVALGMTITTSTEFLA